MFKVWLTVYLVQFTSPARLCPSPPFWPLFLNLGSPAIPIWSGPAPLRPRPPGVRRSRERVLGDACVSSYCACVRRTGEVGSERVKRQGKGGLNLRREEKVRGRKRKVSRTGRYCQVPRCRLHVWLGRIHP